MSELGAGEEFAGHRITGELGRGGMGVVYLATHIALDRPRAIKVLNPGLSADESFAARFRRESRLAASIEHPNVVTIHHAGEEEGRLYLAMQYVEGTDLHEALGAGPLPPARVAAVNADVAAALDAAHEHGLIHRDVKPANVLLAGDAGDPAFLTDFGISKLAAATDPEATQEAGLTSTGAIVGTADYMSPEQVEGRALTPAADVYSLACVAFHVLAGEPPFRRDTPISTLMAHARAERPSAAARNAELPAAVDAVLKRGMAVDPDARPQSAGAFAAELDEALAGGVATRVSAPRPPARPEPPPTEPIRPSPRGRRGVRLLLLSLLAVAAVGGGVALLASSGDGDGSDASEPSTAERPTTEPVATIEVGGSPNGVAVGAGGVWVAGREAGLLQIDPKRNRLKGDPFDVRGARSVAVGHGSAWVVGTDGLTGLDLGSGTVTEVEGPIAPVDVTVDDKYVWVTDEGVPGRPGPGPGRLLRVDPETGSVSGDAPVGLDPRAVSSGEGFVWVANAEDGTVTKVDPGEVRPVGRPIPAGSRPTNIAAGAGAVWVTDFTNGELLRIDPAGERVRGEPIATGPRPRGVAVGAGGVWVASGQLGEVWEFDPESGERVGPIRVTGADPADIAVGSGGVWTADSGAGTVTRTEP